MEKLGMESGRISVGYDVVDNDFFSLSAVNKSDAAPFFLASARFVKKKNLFSLIKAFSIHVHTAQSSSAPWNLCLLGDGELKDELLEYCSKLGVEVFAHAPWGELDKARMTLKPVVYMPGFQQIEDLPVFYSRAVCFIHASTVEQWGLVVNEAMANSLPVIVSHRCGCAQDLVREGINGFTFDPSNVNELAGLMSRVSSMSEESRSAMGLASQEIIKEWGPARFAAGAKQAIATAIEKSRLKAGWMGRMLVEVLSRT
ncbi:MAG: glycosyltransferase [Spartobacteria bacterium]|nr:glycosyltransferase [Spartobacteria bacterium]